MSSSNQDKSELILSKEFAILVFCSIFTQATPLTYQIFLGQGPSEYLQMHFIILSFVGVFVYLTRIVGHSLLVVLPKREEFFSSSLSLTFLLNIFLLITLFSTRSLLLEIYEIDFPLAHSYYSLTIISASIMSINVIWNYYLIFRKEYYSVLKVNLFTLIASLMGNTFCLFMLDNEIKITGYAVVSVGVALLTLFYWIYLLKSLVQSVNIGWVSPLVYLKRAHRVLFGDTAMLVMGIFFPILSGLILVKYGYKEYISIFGITVSVINFITIPAGMLIVYATPLLSQYIDDHLKLRQMIDKIRILVWRFSLYPSTAILLLLVVFSKQLWQLDFFPAGIYLLVVGLNDYLFFNLKVPYVVVIRGFEKQVELSLITFWLRVAALGSLFILAYINYLNLYLYAVITLFLAMVNFTLVKIEARKSLNFT